MSSSSICHGVDSLNNKVNIICNRVGKKEEKNEYDESERRLKNHRSIPVKSGFLLLRL
jgi:hypothetical protein